MSNTAFLAHSDSTHCANLCKSQQPRFLPVQTSLPLLSSLSSAADDGRFTDPQSLNPWLLGLWDSWGRQFSYRADPQIREPSESLLRVPTPHFYQCSATIHGCPSFFGKSFLAPLGVTGPFSDSVTAPYMDSQGALASRWLRVMVSLLQVGS